MTSKKWNVVLKALARLYNVYYAYIGEKDSAAVSEALEELMKAYDEWLD